MNYLAEVPRILWLALPVVVAALVQIVVIKKNWLSSLAVPLDGGRELHGHRVFGDNKTWRGALIYVVVSTLAILPQGYWRLPNLEYFPYEGSTLPLAGFLLGLGWVLGELPNSYVKRRQGIEPGQRGSPVFVILDQVDSLIGCLILLCFITVLPLEAWVVTILLCTLLHMAVNFIFVCVGLKTSVF